MPRALWIAGIALLLSTPALNAQTINTYMSQFRSVFAAWDANKDNSLDKEELARAFLGANAKPYDDGETAKDSDSQKDKPKADYSNYPDYNFLVQLDANSDGKISKGEFDKWARDIAGQMKEQADAVKRIANAQA